MIGIIVTGHGNFASGLTSSLELIAGKQENYIAVDFLKEDGIEQLTEKLDNAIEILKDLDGILVLSDLAGGSPFKTAVVCGVQYEKVEVLAGTNLAMIIEASMSKDSQINVDEFAKDIVSVGKEQVIHFELN